MIIPVRAKYDDNTILGPVDPKKKMDDKEK